MATASSAFYPAVGQPALGGWAESSVAPAKVANLSILSQTCGGLGVNCDVTLAWTKVVQDAGTPATPIYVDEYRINVEKWIGDAVTGSWVQQAPITVTGGAIQKELTNLSKLDLYRFTVQAQQCTLYGEASPALVWPCDFTATVSAAPTTTYGGTGAEMSPYIVNNPSSMTVTVSGGVASKIEMWSGAGGAPQVQTGSLTSATFGIPDPPDDAATPIYINTTLEGTQCSKLIVVWVADEPPPTCPSGSINMNLAGNTVTLSLTNTSSIHTLTLKNLKVRWNTNEAPNNSTLSSVTANGAASTFASSSFASPYKTELWTPPLGATMSPSQANFPVAFTFNLPGKQTLSVNPIKAVCIEYHSQQGDIADCGFTIAGSSATPTVCAVP